MAGKQAFFYGSNEDIRELLKNIESVQKFKYDQSGLFDEHELRSFESLAGIDDIGIAISGDNIQCAGYLVSMPEDEIQIRTIPQRKGGIKYAVDQKENPNTIIFCPGGEFSNESAIIEGRISTAYDNVQSIGIYNLFLKHLKKLFNKHGGSYVGKGAHQLYKTDWRLTQNISSPVGYDLVIEK